MSASLALRLQMHRVPQAPLVRAVANGQFAMSMSDHPSDNVSRHKLAALGEPCLVVVAANDPPQQFVRARDMRDWSLFVIVQAGPERREDYEEIARIVPQHRRVLLVETLPDLTGAWLEFLTGKPLLDLVAPQVSA